MRAAHFPQNTLYPLRGAAVQLTGASVRERLASDPLSSKV